MIKRFSLRDEGEALYASLVRDIALSLRKPVTVAPNLDGTYRVVRWQPLTVEMLTMAKKIFGKSVKASDNYVLIAEAITSDYIQKAIVAALRNSQVISFARTRDGNSLVLKVYDGNENQTAYAADVKELEELLDAIIEQETEEPASSELKKARRG